MNPTTIILGFFLAVAVILLMATFFHLQAAECERDEMLRRADGLEMMVSRADASKREFQVPIPTVNWTAEHVGHLREFLGSETGRVVVAICGQHALTEAMNEAQGDRTSPKAAGMDAMLRFQFNLASDKTLAAISGGSPANEQNTADAEQDASVLVEIRRSF